MPMAMPPNPMNNNQPESQTPLRDDEFFSGYSRLPKRLKRFLFKFVPLLFLGVILFGSSMFSGFSVTLKSMVY